MNNVLFCKRTSFHLKPTNSNDCFISRVSTDSECISENQVQNSCIFPGADNVHRLGNSSGTHRPIAWTVFSGLGRIRNRSEMIGFFIYKKKSGRRECSRRPTKMKRKLIFTLYFELQKFGWKRTSQTPKFTTRFYKLIPGNFSGDIIIHFKKLSTIKKDGRQRVNQTLCRHWPDPSLSITLM